MPAPCGFYSLLTHHACTPLDCDLLYRYLSVLPCRAWTRWSLPPSCTLCCWRWSMCTRITAYTGTSRWALTQWSQQPQQQQLPQQYHDCCGHSAVDRHSRQYCRAPSQQQWVQPSKQTFTSHQHVLPCCETAAAVAAVTEEYGSG